MPDQDLIRKRTPVGLISLACLVAAAVLIFKPEYEGTQAAFLRVGLLLGTFWLAMPTNSRAAAWKPLQSKWTIPALVLFGLLSHRLKYMLPVVAVFAVIAWFARPRQRGTPKR